MSEIHKWTMQDGRKADHVLNVTFFEHKSDGRKIFVITDEASGEDALGLWTDDEEDFKEQFIAATMRVLHIEE